MIRRVSQLSDRGSIKNLVRSREVETGLDREPPTSAEIRFQKLCEYAQTYKDAKMQEALGVITTDYIGDKTALPLSVYRLRKIIEDIKSRPGSQVVELEGLFSDHLKDSVGKQVVAFVETRALIKNASSRKPPVFRRVSVE